MVRRKDNPWEIETKSGLVSIGTHRLYLSASGPSRKPGWPVVIFITGGGAPVIAHTHLEERIGIHARSYFYDRAGYDRSERGPIKYLTAATTCNDLWALLKAVKVGPPYVLVSHSYGGIIARTFLEQHPDEVAGMVLVDVATEMMYQMYPHVPSASLETIGDGIDWDKLTHLHEEGGYSDEEMKEIEKAIERTAPAATAEDNRGSGRALAEKRQYARCVMGDKPLSVIRCNMAHDYRVLYEAGVKAGNGTEAEREDARKFIETFDLFDDEIRFALLRLSKNSRYVSVEDCGHDITMRRPQIIADEVEWVFQRLRG